MSLIGRKEYTFDVISALGHRQQYSFRDPRPSFTAAPQGKRSSNRSTWKTGSTDSLSLLFSLFPKNGSVAETGDSAEKALVRSVSAIAAKGVNDRRIPALLTDYLKSDDPEIRIIAVKGLTGTMGSQASTVLLPLLKTDKNDDVKAEIIRNLSFSANAAASIPVFLSLLKDQSVSSRVKEEIILCCTTGRGACCTEHCGVSGKHRWDAEERCFRKSHQTILT